MGSVIDDVRLPEPLTPRQRVGWLLRSHRVLGDARTLGGLAREFEVSPATISRWETGAVAVTRGAVRRYERSFGLPARTLVAVIDSMYRYWAPSPVSAPALARRPAAWHRTEDLLDQACSPSTLTGSDWDELTFGLVTDPRVHLPRVVWAELAERLLLELTIADGIEWHQRYEAYCRLMAHPRGRHAAIDACVSAGRDRDHQMYVETLSILDASNEPAASAAIVEQLEQPTRDAAQEGALLATVRKLCGGHFSPAQRRRITKVVRALPPQREVVRLLSTVLRSTERTNRVPVFVEARPCRTDHATRRRVVSRVVAAARTQLGLCPTHTDPALDLLVGEMLFALCPGTRLSAASMIAASPYRSAIAHALVAELTSTCVALDRSGWADVLLAALRLVGGPAERRVVEGLAVAPGVARHVARTAAYSLAHLPGATDQRYWDRVLRTPVRDEEVLAGFVYSAGVAGLRPVLEAFRDCRTVPPRPRDAATWWLKQSTA